MAQAYFTLPSFARAKKHREDLEATNPQSPILKDEDEEFLERITSQDSNETAQADIAQIRIQDDGQALISNKQSADQVVIPSIQSDGSADDPAESVPQYQDFASQARSRKPKKNTFNELPSQEEAEAATRGFATGTQTASRQVDEKKSWSSYIPAIGLNKSSPTDTVQSASDETAPSRSDKHGRTWAQYASAYVPTTVPTMSATLPVMPSLPAYWMKSKDSEADSVMNEDGTVNEEATKERQEKEVSVLLDNLNLSSINNRVFAFSQESQKLYERFIQVLKDVMNGVPTAYEDMEKFMKEAGPAIEKQWNAMPPFVQTLVKSLPAKLGATFAPELLAATSGKSGHDASQQVKANGKSAKPGSKQKKKRYLRIPGLKSLVKKQGFAATMLRNITVFLKTRFPLLMGMTNVGMSLSVLVLMLVFYYCWKRGRENRLAKELVKTVSGEGEGEDDEIDIEVTDEGDDDDDEALKSKLDDAAKQTQAASTDTNASSTHEVGEKV